MALALDRYEQDNDLLAPIDLTVVGPASLSGFVMLDLGKSATEIFGQDFKSFIIAMGNKTDLELSNEDLQIVDANISPEFKIIASEFGIDYDSANEWTKKTILQVISKMARVARVDLSKESALKTRILAAVADSVMRVTVGADSDILQTRAEA